MMPLATPPKSSKDSRTDAPPKKTTAPGKRIRFWPQSLAGQLLAALLLALLLAQLISILLFANERSNIAVSTTRSQVLDRTAAVVRLLNETSDNLHERVIRAAEGPGLLYQLRDSTTLSVPRDGSFEAGLTRRLERRAELEEGSVRISKIRDRSFLFERPKREDDDAEQAREDRAWSEEQRQEMRMQVRRWREDGRRGPPPDHFRRRQPDLSTLDMTIAVPLDNGQWLQVRTGFPSPPKEWGRPFLISMGVMAAIIALVVIFTVRRLTAPLRGLEAAARKLGRGEAIEPLAEEGPKEVRNTIVAFNAMQERLMRFVQDRTRMLAAVSHDLRTPITTLRLRAEFIDDEEMRDKILATLDEMQAMTDAVLVFAREDATSEETIDLDLAALISSMVDDYEEMGKAVQFTGPDSFTFSCRAVSLKRAIRNLVENALRYAGDAEIELRPSAKAVEIIISDHGPGIPADKLEEAFAPFFRVESSRNMETGGVGLGLSITRTIIRSHGGDITLANRAEGGLLARITLPR